MTEMTMASVLEKNATFYRDCAARYDQGRAHFFHYEGRRVQKDLEWIAGGRKLAGATVMDVGCGTGFYGLMAVTNGVRKVHCLDIDQTFLDITEDKLCDRDATVEIVPHLSDLEAFAAKPSEAKRDIDLYIMGSVLQHVADLAGTVGQIVDASPGACLYVSSTRLPRKQTHARLEKLMAILDYRLHRTIHRRDKPGARRQPEGVKTTFEVDTHALRTLCEERGYLVKTYRYTSFHTGLFNRLHSVLRWVFPSFGTYFTLIALKVSP